ncbi:Transcription initiation TFIID-like [Plasmodium knowlesi strain H]|uniref:Transcription initiation TFIID-like n=3 Tax=Plasmodium knowlesi TaxID=5850 RepID=B3LAA3_PLAKH|nr:Transcription initiation TFIID-like [Plasmodium knowlesi strain H]OTN67605.1 Transcription initiation TFIID-like [Plasmodium knowlesi]CAA9990335.1 Transcription initiation TFIID-like [Plasmodium knowlesi strain H]SBO22752.1 Transcription initiation TFIID-like [Plasmodium knowlesi strain H]VVS79809.1 Transcription initiation TFIID-like [Plasmodium knowlesi strain H]|eukprot:XP_002260735.1 Transcription initiation TFIID-like [Plasmodium knowlesi strain H]
MAQPLKRAKLNSEQAQNIYAQSENNMSVHNISMNATLCSSLNLDNLYKHFANCIYNPREFKCMRIDVPVSTRSIEKYVRFVNEKGERQRRSEGVVVSSDGTNVVIPPPWVATTSQVVEAQKGDVTITQGNDGTPEEQKGTKEKIIINVSIFANGKIICTGNNSIEACKIAMKKIEKKLKQLNFKNICIKNVTITNILAVYNVGFSIVLPLFAQYYKSVDYDPNVFPACKVKIALTSENERDTSEATEQAEGNLAWSTARGTAERARSKVDVVSASIFSTGNITLTGGKSYQNLQRCIDILYPYLIKSKSQH